MSLFPFRGAPWRSGCAALGIVLSHAAVAQPAPVVLSEIMYHPASEDVREEYVELHNLGTTNVPLRGWQFSGGIRFAFTNEVILPPGGYWVVAADPAVFGSRHPEVTNVVGGWTGLLSNQGEEVILDDALGSRVDRVRYADEGDWARRRRAPEDRNHRGVIWQDAHDGQGSSLELIQAGLSNDHGQNWGASSVTNGTPGGPNSLAASNVAPFILQVQHFPVLPRSSEDVVVTAQLVDESSPVSATLFWRVDEAEPLEFSAESMWDDGAHEDGAPGDGFFAGRIPAQTNRAVVEFYVVAADGEGRERVWPSPVIEEDGSSNQVANALFQVDDTPWTGTQPIYRLVFREIDRAELYQIGHAYNGEQNSDAQFNATWVTQDGGGTECHYGVGVRNRGHGSRSRQPNSYRVNFRSDDSWKGVVALNLNGQYTYLQHLGSALCLMAGVPASETRPAQVRLNGVNLGDNGPRTYGSTYVALEALDSDFANHRFPVDGSGNVYRANRDVAPSDFSWRGEDFDAYRNTWFKSTNTSEDDWSDLLGLLRVLGTNDLYSVENARAVADVDEWLRYLAVMALINNRETSPNTGYNDDYYLYAGVEDPRFRLVPHDLDTILGEGDTAGSTTSGVLGVTGMPAFAQLLETPEFETAYYQVLRRLLDSVFAPAPFRALMDQTLGDFVPASTRDRMASWMTARAEHVRSLLPPDLPPDPVILTVVLEGVPRSRTSSTDAVISVGGDGVAQYRYALDGADWSPSEPITEPLSLAVVAPGHHDLRVWGGTAEGEWQPESMATGVAWEVIPGWPAVRLNEVLARNDTSAGHEGTFPDLIELFNEGPVSVDLSGYRLTDSAAMPGKFVFPAGTELGPGEFLVVYANDPDGTGGLHAGFSLAQDGEGVFLYGPVSQGSALLDSVEFGLQLADRSVGRLTGREWHLGSPSPGEGNARLELGDPRGLRINEWLTDARVRYADDFFELYNPADRPVALGGLWLTDNITSAPDRHVIVPLSFVGPSSCRVFWADGHPEHGADHVSFKLASEQGELGLYLPDGSPIDRLVYGPQRTDVSQGRQPSGAETWATFLVPTPGGLNPGAGPAVSVETATLVSLTNMWRYEDTQDLTGTGWEQPEFDDGTWPSAPAIFYHDSDPLPGPTNTVLPAVPVTAYFRTSFTYTGAVEGASLEFQPFVDDGAVVYLNGREVYRLRLPATGPIEYLTVANPVVNARLEDPLLLSTEALLVGTNVLAVEVHQTSTTSADVAFGLALTASITVTNVSSIPVVLNELVAAGDSEVTGAGGDWLELINWAAEPYDLTGLSLTDDPGEPRKYVFPAGSTVGGGGHLRLSCDAAMPASATNTGFALNRGGDGLYLFESPSQGGGLADSVEFGLQPEGYSLARVPDGLGDWRLALPTPEAPNLAAVLAEAGDVRINEWMANPANGIDWFELYNPAGQPVAIGGLYLTDDLVDRAKHRIAPHSYLGAGPSAHGVFWADSDPGLGPDHVNFRLDAAGDSLGLFTAGGSAMDQVSFGPQGREVSEGRFPDGAALWATFTNTVSRGGPNWWPLPTVVINEVLTHTDPPLEDAVELLNLGSVAVDLAGWHLSNSERDPRRYRLPPGTVLEPGRTLVLYEQAFGDPASATAFTFNSARGDQVVLAESDPLGGLTGFRAVAGFGPAANGVSFGRRPTSMGVDFVALRSRTFGEDTPVSVEVFRQGTGAPNSDARVGPVVISELMFFPPPAVGTNDNTRDEFIELQNLEAHGQPLHDPSIPANAWRIDGAVSYVFPPGTQLGPGEVVLLVGFDPATAAADWDAFRTRYPGAGGVRVFGPFSGRLSNQAETVQLLKPDPPQLPPHPDAGLVPYVLVESVQYQAQAPWPGGAAGTGDSLQRQQADWYGNEPLHWNVAVPTPGVGAPASAIPDSDQDGLPDDWERLYFGTIDAPDATPDQDPDQDGMTNAEEFAAGTIPNRSDSLLALSLPVPGAQGWRVGFQAAADRGYAVQVRTSWSEPGWQNLTNVEPASLERWVEVDDPSPTESARYYRLLLTSPIQP